MQPVKLSIMGDYWDVQIYRGRLYLWEMNGRVSVYSWDGVVEKVAQQAESQLAATIAFGRGDLLYTELSEHGEFVEWASELLEGLGRQEFNLNRKDMQPFLLHEQENPFRDLPIDTDIFDSTLYGLCDSGLWSATVHRPYLKQAISSRPRKISDAKAYSVRAKSGRLALAAGSDGLLEVDIGREQLWEEGEHGGQIADLGQGTYQVSARHCSQAEWAFSSIYCSSHETGGYLVGFNWRKPDAEELDVELNIDDDQFEQTIAPAPLRPALEYVGLFDEREISGNGVKPKTSWGAQDKIYFIRNGQIETVRFVQSKLRSEEPAFRRSEAIDLRADYDPINAGVAYFGSIIETDEAIVVLQSDGTRATIPGPITRWRLYPRAIRYENHLHVILNDRLLIASFNGDYFVDQDTKLLGMNYDIAPKRRYDP